MNRPMTTKPPIGIKGKRIGYTDSRFIPSTVHKDVGKVSVYIPELKMSVMIVPGTDLAPIIKKHKDAKEFRLKSGN